MNTQTTQGATKPTEREINENADLYFLGWIDQDKGRATRKKGKIYEQGRIDGAQANIEAEAEEAQKKIAKSIARNAKKRQH